MKRYTITVNGIAYDVTVEEGTSNNTAPVAAAPAIAPAPAQNPAPVSSAAGSVKIDAPMPGNILDVKVSVGDSVASGQVLLILEAMKMENDIVAPSEGTVASVNVRKGDTVEAGQILITLN